MKTISKLVLLSPVALLSMLVEVSPDLPAPYVQFVPEAHAIFGVRRRTAVVAASAGAAEATAAASASVSAANQQAAASQQQAAAAKQEAAAAKQEAAIAEQQAAAAKAAATAAPPVPAAAPGNPLPVGTVVVALPGGCVATPVGGVQYYYCGGNFYRAVFQGNQLVYVTAQPK